MSRGSTDPDAFNASRNISSQFRGMSGSESMFYSCSCKASCKAIRVSQHQSPPHHICSHRDSSPVIQSQFRTQFAMYYYSAPLFNFHQPMESLSHSKVSIFFLPQKQKVAHCQLAQTASEL